MMDLESAHHKEKKLVALQETRRQVPGPYGQLLHQPCIHKQPHNCIYSRNLVDSHGGCSCSAA